MFVNSKKMSEVIDYSDWEQSVLEASEFVDKVEFKTDYFFCD